MVSSIEPAGIAVEPVLAKLTVNVELWPTDMVAGTKFAPVMAGSAACPKTNEILKTENNKIVNILFISIIV